MEVGHKGQYDRYENIRKLQGRIETLKDVFATGQTTRIYFYFLRNGQTTRIIFTFRHSIITLHFDIPFFFLETYTIFDCTKMYSHTII